MNKNTHLLYSFRRCPYAMRARMALLYAGIGVQILEVDLKNKPSHLLAISPKGTVPVLVLHNETIIDESVDIMHWSLAQNDPDQWLPADKTLQIQCDDLIMLNDKTFTPLLNRYKYSDRYPQNSEHYYREQTEKFAKQLEQQLTKRKNLITDQMTIADIALLPFVRQFAQVDRAWFDQSPYQRLREWLDNLLNTELFQTIMQKDLTEL